MTASFVAAQEIVHALGRAGCEAVRNLLRRMSAKARSDVWYGMFHGALGMRESGVADKELDVAGWPHVSPPPPTVVSSAQVQCWMDELLAWREDDDAPSFLDDLVLTHGPIERNPPTFEWGCREKLTRPAAAPVLATWRARLLDAEAKRGANRKVKVSVSSDVSAQDTSASRAVQNRVSSLKKREHLLEAIPRTQPRDAGLFNKAPPAAGPPRSLRKESHNFVETGHHNSLRNQRYACADMEDEASAREGIMW